ncbi:helix-turn-helix transcriptional regulator [Gordonia sp. CPCC 205515]|uniref:helix-turn-helix domain-containing protein n=1 Tax=Gordonia sp. CPCC 205515 TaxID=3140791 RepID=UPI003AF3D628
MPARSPDTPSHAERALAEIGRVLRARRLALGVSATTTAESAGMSRVTLHRIEAGSPSVTIGAYLNAATALGLELTVGEAPRPAAAERASVPAPSATVQTVRIGDYQQLQAISWHLSPESSIPEVEALELYERNWRHIDQAAMTDDERRFVQHLADAHGSGIILV